jgi:hypothetical protein
MARGTMQVYNAGTPNQFTANTPPTGRTFSGTPNPNPSSTGWMPVTGNMPITSNPNPFGAPLLGMNGQPAPTGAAPTQANPNNRNILTWMDQANARNVLANENGRGLAQNANLAPAQNRTPTITNAPTPGPANDGPAPGAIARPGQPPRNAPASALPTNDMSAGIGTTSGIGAPDGSTYMSLDDWRRRQR